MAIQFECADGIIKLYHNGTLIREAYRSSQKFQEHGESFIEVLAGTKVDDIPLNVHFYIDRLPDEFSPATAVSLDNSENGMSVLLQLEFTDLDSWSESYSYGSYVDQLDALIEGQSLPIKKYSKHDATDLPHFAALGLTFNLIEGDVVENILAYAQRISLAQQEAHANLLNYAPKNVLVKLFDFPEGFEVICVQYLVWFGEFLAELGINAQVISEQNGTKTKFIVAPENAGETLAKIEELFYKYLSLPYAEYLPANDSDSGNKAFILSLKAQVDHFKTQIQFKEAIIETQNQTIDSLKVRCDQFSSELLLLNSVRDERLELFGGVLSLGSIEWGPFRISPNVLLKKLGHKKS